MKKQIYGKELILDLKDCDLKVITSAKKLREFVYLLTDLLKMRRYKNPIIARFGLNKDFTAGFSVVQLIETSSITCHFSEKWKKAFINVFSCKNFDEKKVIEFVKKFLGGKIVKRRVLLR